MSGAPEYDFDPEIRAEFLDESLEALEKTGPCFIDLEKKPEHTEPVHPIYRAFHSIKGNSAYFHLLEVKRLAHSAETLLSKVRSGALRASPEVIDALLAATDEMTAMLRRVRGNGPEVQDAEALSGLIARLEKLAAGRQVPDGAPPVMETMPGASTAQTGASPHKEMDRVPGAHPDTQEARPAEAEPEKTMRVRESTIDEFLKYVGDLIGVHEAYEHIRSLLECERNPQTAAKSLRRANEAFQDLSQALQKAIMEIRRVPMRRILDRVPRIVRDIAQAQGKQIDVTVEGGGLLVDKSIVEAMESPLMHMIRNAADHGIEKPEVRRAAGKPATGRIGVRAEERGDKIILRVEDDGRGLNLEALAAKGVAMGLLSAGAAHSREQVTEVLFAPGVSTASEITDVSGRGVGMDVVKQAVEALGGRIRVESEQGKGCGFTVELSKSVSTQIISVFLVAVSGNRYALPLNRVMRCFRPAERTMTDLVGRGTLIEDNGSLLPLLRMDRVLSLAEQGPSEESEDGICVVIQSKHRQTALLVDHIIGVRQVVPKPIHDALNPSGLFTGAATMGDGSIALVLDPEAVAASQIPAAPRSRADSQAPIRSCSSPGQTPMAPRC